MNIKAMYAAGGAIAAVAIVIFLVISSGIFGNGNFHGQVGFNQNALKDTQAIKLSIKNISGKAIVGNKTANIQVVFNAYNPNSGTVILEAISYNVFVNNIRLISNDIGAKLEGFVASQEGVFPVIGNGTVILKDTQVLHRNNLIADSWSKIVEGKANYVVNGTYSYKQTSSIQATGEDRAFRLTYP
jgi:LEA14-like dessication related protein